MRNTSASAMSSTSVSARFRPARLLPPPMGHALPCLGPISSGTSRSSLRPLHDARAFAAPTWRWGRGRRGEPEALLARIFLLELALDSPALLLGRFRGCDELSSLFLS